jgi:hypothetical protein
VATAVLLVSASIVVVSFANLIQNMCTDSCALICTDMGFGPLSLHHAGAVFALLAFKSMWCLAFVAYSEQHAQHVRITLSRAGWYVHIHGVLCQHHAVLLQVAWFEGTWYCLFRS